jgi:ribonuclease HIII
MLCKQYASRTTPKEHTQQRQMTRASHGCNDRVQISSGLAVGVYRAGLASIQHVVIAAAFMIVRYMLANRINRVNEQHNVA